ncbi:glycoside hydrolase family 13 protein [Microbacterium sp. No. 7]|uniref:glycoside hydrolase family 13 protein n=1 Tax=Microbacterium sp. No. 7 TaxID=1714373 RepID=UPI0018D1178D|nr:alpha-amylase family glycosyl hydrolase [Microbacterium sp. No. 7]
MTIASTLAPIGENRIGAEWWRSAVIYQVYPRSFADANGDGIGDLAGITAHLDDLVSLGVDAIWLSPFYTSPQNDAGYDVADYCDIDPRFGTLADFDRMLAAAHARGIRVVVDLVPNHSSSEHEWFQQALAAGPGSAERARYLFRDGTGENGELPPNNWQSVFGGPAWTRVADGQWYLHLFDVTQPDFDWNNPEVHEFFTNVLRFWLDRGVDGFRVDVAHGLVKHEDLPDHELSDDPAMGGGEHVAPYWGQEAVHDIYREWNAVLREYDGDRALCAEAWLPTVDETALWVRQDEMHQAFNFPYLTTKWDADDLRAVISESLRAYPAVGAPATWVLSNHDVIRHASRLALTEDTARDGGIGPRSTARPIPELGLRRARAATTLMLALPGSAYLYQGEELGLPEATDLPDEVRQDPTWFRTDGERYGRDGCRVPIPWVADAPAYGFNETGASWLPQPAEWAALARDAQEGDPASTLWLYRTLLANRRQYDLGAGSLEWLDGFRDDVIAVRNGAVTVVVNLGSEPVALPSGTLVVASSAFEGAELPADTAVWLLAD